jgi:hypothetical protein
MKIVALKNKFLVEGKVYEVSESTGNALINKGAAYLEGAEEPKPKRKRRSSKS